MHTSFIAQLSKDVASKRRKKKIPIAWINSKDIENLNKLFLCAPLTHLIGYLIEILSLPGGDPTKPNLFVLKWLEKNVDMLFSFTICQQNCRNVLSDLFVIGLCHTQHFDDSLVWIEWFGNVRVLWTKTKNNRKCTVWLMATRRLNDSLASYVSVNYADYFHMKFKFVCYFQIFFLADVSISNFGSTVFGFPNIFG